MALGLSRPRNYGCEAQKARLAIVMRAHRVAYKVKTERGMIVLYLAACDGRNTLPFESAALLVNTRRGHWEAKSLVDDRLLVGGVSKTDVIAATINEVLK